MDKTTEQQLQKLAESIATQNPKLTIELAGDLGHVHCSDFDDAASAREILRELPNALQQARDSTERLTKQQELVLFRGMNLLKWLTVAVKSDSLMSVVATEDSASKTAQQYDLSSLLKDTREFLINKNWPLVLQRVGHRQGILAHSRDELTSAGSEGLIKAVDRFDYNRGIKFSTFAFRYIDGGILNWLTKQLNRLRKESGKTRNDSQFHEQHARTPDDQVDPRGSSNPSQTDGPRDILGPRGDVQDLLVSALSVVAMETYSAMARRSVTCQLRKGFLAKYTKGSIAARLDALGGLVGSNRKTVGGQIGEYVHSLSRIAIARNDETAGDSARQESENKLRNLLQPVAMGVAKNTGTPEYQDGLLDHLVTKALTLHEDSDCRFVDLLPYWVEEFLAPRGIATPLLWKWGKDVALKQLQRETPVRSFLEQNHQRVDQWELAYECSERDLMSFGQAVTLSVALFLDPGNWELPEPAEAKNRIFIACMNSVHAFNSTGRGSHYLPRKPSEDYYALASSDAYWAEVLEASLDLLRKSLVSRPLEALHVLQEE